MLIRFLVKNLFSFNELTEFNMLPGRYNRLPKHVYNIGGTEVLKLNSIYGANGAGKSNLIRALGVLREFIVDGDMPSALITDVYKPNKKNGDREVYLGIEYERNDISYYYSVTINDGIVTNEELLISGLGEKEDEVLFLRTDEVSVPKLTVTFSKVLENDKASSLFPEFLQNEILERNKLVLHYMQHRQNEVFEVFKNAFDWFNENLIIVTPNSRPEGLIVFLETNDFFFKFSNEMIKSFNTGITKIKIETIPLEEFLGEEDRGIIEKVVAQLRAKPDSPVILRNSNEEVYVIMSEGKPYAKRIFFTHGGDKEDFLYAYSEESDGTRRLMDYLPAIFNVINNSMTYVIDEIERSLHPTIIKELVRKFSHDDNTKGQLIFSTHESNLLDQTIFRPDEIWFVEKNKEGATELYPLSDFKEHHTIDIRRGYLNGRYGAIPFLGNLKDLNWDQYAEAN